MEVTIEPPKLLVTRHRCVACLKQFNRKDHLVEHMKISFHSVHQPRCPVCQKYCPCFESIREHLIGPGGKVSCKSIFSEKGCALCLKIFDTSDTLSKHKEACRRTAPAPIGTSYPYVESQNNVSSVVNANRSRAVAMDCEMVGGNDGSVPICARVCLVDEDENILLHAYVQPLIPVTDYRYEITGITEENLKDAMPANDVKQKILQILCNGEPMSRIQQDGGRAFLLVGHNIKNDLHNLRIVYPDHMLRDTSTYQPLTKTNLVSHSLKYLTKTYLGYDIQTGVHDPYEDSVSAMRLYKRFRSFEHQEIEVAGNPKVGKGFDSYKSKDLERMSPTALFEISKSNYRCWCKDLGQTAQP